MVVAFTKKKKVSTCFHFLAFFFSLCFSRHNLTLFLCSFPSPLLSYSLVALSSRFLSHCWSLSNSLSSLLSFSLSLSLSPPFLVALYSRFLPSINRKDEEVRERKKRQRRKTLTQFDFSMQNCNLTEGSVKNPNSILFFWCISVICC